MANAANWWAPVALLQKDTTTSGLSVTTSDLGKILAVGEPTLATVDGRLRLY